ncbi:nitroreductase family protein [Bacillus sp. S/N-304-OC-R1]|uniref:nitroreductase family protein n=1 Tax=Bacillus sp. S/N-304-OC-R1 TaxID=2758034 RepID=UPI001C8DF90D|nr:nitroreductase family protein [Bacillus sp. S/N-304-OC-R1]MBY0122104.1 nitroreductase family protein [Bacillus sp. S/N-304-OC-R1]
MTETYTVLSEVIRERKSVRKFDPSYTISKEEIASMLKQATEAPSSSNLQPWRFIVIQDQETKKKVKQIAYNQEQIETCSAVIAVIADTEMHHNIDKIYRSNFEAGNIDEINLERQTQNAKALYPSVPSEVRMNIASFDTGLISMQLMLLAKAKGYDTVCMGGFNKKQFAEEFELDSRYAPVVLIALGKAAAPAYNSTRMAVEEIATFI